MFLWTNLKTNNRGKHISSPDIRNKYLLYNPIDRILKELLSQK